MFFIGSAKQAEETQAAIAKAEAEKEALAAEAEANKAEMAKQLEDAKAAMAAAEAKSQNLEGALQQAQEEATPQVAAEAAGDSSGSPDAAETAQFGVPLALAAERSDPDGLVPSVLRQGLAWLNDYGLDEQGLWRIPGSQKRVEELRAEFEAAGLKPVDLPSHELAENVTGLVLKYLKALPEPLFTAALAPEFETCRSDATALADLVGRLPAPHRASLRLMFGHLSRVCANARVNRMTPHALSLSIPSLLGTVGTLMVTDYEAVFGPRRRPAPPTPSGGESGGGAESVVEVGGGWWAKRDAETARYFFAHEDGTVQ